MSTLALTLPSFSAWASTYLLHSTLFVAVGLAACAALKRPESRSIVLRGAILGALLSTASAGLMSVGPRWLVFEARPTSDLGAPTTSANELGVAVQPNARGVLGLAGASAGDVAAARAAAPAAAPTTDRGPALPAGEHARPDPATLVGWTLGLAVVGAALRFALRALAARARLARRRPLEDPKLHSLARALGSDGAARRPIRLSVSDDLDVPLALGAREVVLPARALRELDEAALSALLAHELGHLARRDPLWLGLARLTTALAWFQPLHRVLLRRLEDEAELAADAWAVARTEHPLALARVLERVAGWVAPEASPVLGVAMARHGSTLVQRVERLLAPRAPSLPRRPAPLALATLATILVVACAGPVVQSEPGPQAASARALSGAEAFELLSQAIHLAELTDAPVWKVVSSERTLDFGAHPWARSAPDLQFEVAGAPEAPSRAAITAFGVALADAHAAGELARLAAARCPGLRASVVPLDAAPTYVVSELLDALVAAGLTHIDLAANPSWPASAGSTFVPSTSGAGEPRGVLTSRPYLGPDAEPGERRFVLRLDADGNVRGLPQGSMTALDVVQRHLDAMRSGPLDPDAGEGSLVVRRDRLVLEAESTTPFRALQEWMAALATSGPRPSLWKIEMALAGATDAQVVSTFLPVDLGLDNSEEAPWVVEEVVEESSDAAETEPTPVRRDRIDILVQRDLEGRHYEVCSADGKDRVRAKELTLEVFPDGGRGMSCVIDARRDVTFDDVMHIVRPVAAAGGRVTFVGSYEPSEVRAVLDAPAARRDPRSNR